MNVALICGPSGISTIHSRMYIVPPIFKPLIYPPSLESPSFRRLQFRLQFFRNLQVDQQGGLLKEKT